ncbi:MAG: ATP-dependent Clp protease ATP-binding subunit [Myxococcota bacterium]|nr:ATP-dependent Clp protease ATP-binding subunit [Myxococcota bacterium]
MSAKTFSTNSKKVLEQARDIAKQADPDFTTAHILFAFFVVPNSAEMLLHDFGINEETLLARFDPKETERSGLSTIAESRSGAFAESTASDAIFCLHLLIALTELADGIAYRLLVRAGVSMKRLRERALDYAAEGAPEHWSPSPGLHSGRQETASYAELRTNLREQTDTDLDLPALGEVTVQAPAVKSSDSKTGHRRQRAQSKRQQTPEERRQNGAGRRAGDKVDSNGRRLDRRADDLTADGQNGVFDLDPERYPALTKLGRNLSSLAAADKFDPVISRDSEIEQVIDVLNKRRSNNPCLVGEPGVGKTAVVEGVVTAFVRQQKAAQGEVTRIFVQIDVGAILAGTHLRGSLAERLRCLQEEIKDAAGRVVIFIDEIHTLIGAGGGDGAHDAANELKAALARGEFPCIGATTIDEYRTHVESDSALERRFTSIHVNEPSVDDTIEIVRAVTDRYADHHGVRYADEAIRAAVNLGRRYLHDRRDPDRALSILDLAGAVARRAGSSVDRRAIAEVIARNAQVPIEHLLVDDPDRFLSMETRLSEHVIGQSHVLVNVSETIRRNLAGFTSNQPIGSFLFLGPTGVGKTEAVKALAQFLFGSRDALVRFDMSEFLESHSVSRLIGSPPGYVGHQEGGQLTDRIRQRPYQVVLFDEIEKSHRDVWNVLLQILDEGHLSDARGRLVDFSNTLVVMTSNLGAESFSADGRRIGFSAAGRLDPEQLEAKVQEKAQSTFPPELWNRIESKLVFHPLTRDEIKRIARLQVKSRSDALASERGITFTASDDGLDYLIETGGFEPELGARPMRRAIANQFETPMAKQILANRIVRGDRITIGRNETGLVFEVIRGSDGESRISGSFIAAEESWIAGDDNREWTAPH